MSYTEKPTPPLIGSWCRSLQFFHVQLPCVSERFYSCTSFRDLHKFLISALGHQLDGSHIRLACPTSPDNLSSKRVRPIYSKMHRVNGTEARLIDRRLGLGQSTKKFTSNFCFFFCFIVLAIQGSFLIAYNDRLSI